MKRPKTSKKSRKYNNSTRSEKSNVNRQKIIENYVALLVEKRGDEISLEELAERSDLSTRTLFRFFGDKKTLTQELEKYLEQYVLAATINLEKMSFEEFAEYTYKLFDKYENLILAYLYTNFGQTSRVLFRKKLNAILLEKIKTQTNVKNNKDDLRKIYFIISLISGNIWADIKDNYNEKGEDMAATVKWAVKTLLSQI